MSRHERRAEVSRFKREAARGVVSYLVDAADPRLAGEPLLSRAVAYWRANIPTRKPRCFACRTPFAADGAQASAFLMVTAASAPTSATVSGLCTRCWSDLPMPEIERAAERALRPVVYGLVASEDP
jgi:hypothetical protein